MDRFTVSYSCETYRLRYQIPVYTVIYHDARLPNRISRNESVLADANYAQQEKSVSVHCALGVDHTACNCCAFQPAD